MGREGRPSLYRPASTAPKPARTLTRMATAGPIPILLSPMTLTPARAAPLAVDEELAVLLAWLEVAPLVVTWLVVKPVPAVPVVLALLDPVPVLEPELLTLLEAEIVAAAA